MKERGDFIELGLHHEAFIDACVEGERYRDRRDVLESAMRLLEEREAHFGAACAELTVGAERLASADPMEELPPELFDLLRSESPSKS
ncbi:MAG: type II toxin-antitoxin system ParD family antitoxin [Planctomycetota bacterium]